MNLEVFWTCFAGGQYLRYKDTKAFFQQLQRQCWQCKRLEKHYL